MLRILVSFMFVGGCLFFLLLFLFGATSLGHKIMYIPLILFSLIASFIGIYDQ